MPNDPRTNRCECLGNADANHSPRTGIVNTSIIKDFIYALALLAMLVGQGIGQDIVRSAPRKVNPHVASYEEMQRVNRRLAGQTGPLATFDPGWWNPLVARPLTDAEPLALTLEQVLISALANSKQIQVFSELPLIRETAITEASSAFDWTAFINARWDDRSDPIGSTLTAGPGISRFRDHQVSLDSGARRRTRTGGQVQIAQQHGFQDNNSQFFVPDPQGTSRLTLNFTQPLMRGRGRVYNESLIVLARIDKAVANDEFRRQLETHLLEVSRAYWALYLERAVWYQKTNSYLRGKRILERLEQRRGLDAQTSQIVSARAAMKQRQAELTRANAAVRNAESRLRALVNDPLLMQREIIPADAPRFDYQPVDLNEVVTVAFQQRPEVGQAVKQVRAAGVRMEMSRHEILPLLNLVTEAYVAGLEDRGQVFASWVRQFDTGEPGYGIGLQYEVPLYRRGARARLQRRRLELRQLEAQYATTLETVRLEAEVAVREVETAYTELETLALRWSQLPGEDVTSSLALENLLHSQERLAESEFAYLKAQLTYNLSLVNLKRAAGLLMRHEKVVVGRACECCLPRQILDKPDLNLEGIEFVPTGSIPLEELETPAPAAGLQHSSQTPPEVIVSPLDAELNERSRQPPPSLLPPRPGPSLAPPSPQSSVLQKIPIRFGEIRPTIR